MNTPDEKTRDPAPPRRGRMLNPVAAKRWQRFRRHRRGFWSMCLLAGLYFLSLFSEFLCNDRPLVIRHEGRFYFPVVRFYPEHAFLGNGQMTRPDYKKLLQHPDFSSSSDNWMLFPPVPYGPNEIIDPSTLRAEEEVTLTVRLSPRVGSVQVDGSLRVGRSQNAATFLAGLSEGDALDRFWPVTEALREGIRRRMANQADPSIREIVTRPDAGITAEISLAAFTPRREAPRDVRVTFREVVGRNAAPQPVIFNRGLEASPRDSAWWEALAPATRSELTGMASNAFGGSLVSRKLMVDGSEFAVEIQRNDVQWPFRPNPSHWLGIDNAGRDVFARILYGLRTSMTFGLLLALFSMGFGTFMGAVQGYYGGRIDLVAQRLIEIWGTIPFLYVMIWLGSLYGRSFALLLFCYGIFNWIGISAYVRAEFLRLRRMPFVDAARCLGLSGPVIMFRHILPNALTPIITFFPFSLVGAIGSLAMLDYLGFGLPPPTPSWGELLQQAQAFRWAWWLILYPSLALFAVMLMGVFIGEAVRDAYDPKPVMRMT